VGGTKSCKEASPQPYPIHPRTRQKKKRRRKILILSHKAITRRSRRRDEKGPKENYEVVYGMREGKIRDQTRHREKILLPTQTSLCVKLKTPTKHKLKTTSSYKQMTIMREIPNHIYSGTER